MQLKYGGYPFDINACRISTRIDTLETEALVPYATIKGMSVRGYLVGDGQTDLTLKASALLQAMSVPFQDLIFYRDDGSESVLSLRNAGSSTGVRIKRGPNFPFEPGNNYITQLLFDFEAEAEYPLSGNGGLLKFRELVETDGGGPMIIHQPCINGLPQKRQIYPATAFMATQKGEAEGYIDYPSIPPPIWPADLKKFYPKTATTSPDRRGSGYQRYALGWEYTFESVKPLAGLPHFFP